MSKNYGTVSLEEPTNVKVVPTKMNEERQPLLLSGGSDAESVTQDPPPRPDLRCSPENTLVDVNSHVDPPSELKSINAGEEYDPMLSRGALEHPTSNMDTMIHLLKGNIGTGILAMPDAFRNAGLFVGLFGTLMMGAICTHCMHMLVRCAHELCRRCQVPSLDFADVVFMAFQTGPINLRKFAKNMKIVINIFLCITQLGFCCVYFVFVAANLQEVIGHYFVKLDVRVYLLCMVLPMIVLNWVKNLKYLTPVSLFAAILTITGLAVTFFYLLQDLPHTSTVNSFSSWGQLPLYFGTAIYAFEGIGVVLPLENNMRTPQDFGGLTGVLNTGMVVVACLYTAVGFFGYLKYGDAVKVGSITLNLPPNDILAQSVRVSMALAIFLSYCLQFYVPLGILWPYVSSRLSTDRAKQLGEYAFRSALVVFTFVLAAMIPNLAAVISLVGAVSSSTLALIFPPIIEIITFWPDGLGKNNWMLYKDIGILIFGILGFIFGSYTSIENILYPEI